MADLHGRAGNLTRRHVHFHAGKGRAAQPIAPRPAANRHNQVAWLRLGAVRAARQNAQAAAVDQRIGGVAGVVVDGAVYCGDAHFVAVIFHAVNHAVGDARRVQHVGRQLVVGQIGRAKAEHVGVGNGAGADAQYIAHHAPHARIRPAKRLQRRGVVVGFHLKRQIELLVEGDDARVVHKRGAHPGFVDLLRGGADVGVEQAVDMLGFTIRAGVLNLRLECLVDAVFAPGLGDHFQLHIGGIALFGAVIGLDGLHFGQIQRQPPFLADSQKRRLVGFA